MTEEYALQEAAEKYLITLAAHRANTRDISAVEDWYKATSEFMALVDNDELNIIASLFNELKTNKQNIKTLESRNRRLEGIIDAAEKRIAELEARTVNLPKRSVGEVMHMSGFSRDYAEGWCAGNDNAIHEIRAAGIGKGE